MTSENLTYAVAPVGGEPTRLSMHRQILGLVNDKTKHVCHVNGNTLDNRRENLRVVACGGRCVQARRPTVPASALLPLVEEVYWAESAFDRPHDDLLADTWATLMGQLLQVLNLRAETRKDGEHEIHLFPSIGSFLLVDSNGSEFQPADFFDNGRTDIERIEYRPRRRYTKTAKAHLEPERLKVAKESARANGQSLSEWLRGLIDERLAAHEEERMEGEMMCFLDWEEKATPAERERASRSFEKLFPGPHTE